LYRVAMPEGAVGLSTAELAILMRRDHHATVLAVTRAGQTVANPPHGFRMESGDELVVLAYELGQMTAVIKEKVVQEGADHSKDVSPILGGVPSVSEGRG